MADHLGSRLAATRKAAGVSSTDVAIAAGLHPVHVRKIERGERPNLALSTASALAEALGVNLNWLANGAGHAPSPEVTKAAIRAGLKKHAPVAEAS